ncbi:MAG: hypothetical protein O7E52_01475 [Candidatus Poribacteria bacterium]|nr:hypothetical protein [Candidatus Poribacteria bacterium]
MNQAKNSAGRWIFVLAAVWVSTHLIAQTQVQAQKILFEDNFDKSKDKLDGTGKWHTVSGSWSIRQGRLVQGQANGKALILVSDEHWDEAWNSYWFYATIKLTGGTSPLIFWRFHSDEGGGFGAENDLPPRMQESLRRHLIYWVLNRNGQKSVVHRSIRHVTKDFEKTETRTKLDRGIDYWIKIENAKQSYRLFLTDNGAAAVAGDYGPPLVDVKDININGEGRIGFGTEDARIEVDNVFVTAPEENPFAVEAQGKLTTTWGRLKYGEVR